MLDTSTSRAIVLEDQPRVPATGCWSVNTEPRQVSPLRRALNAAGVAVVVFGTPLTGIADPWQADDRRRSALTRAMLLQTPSGRRVTLGEARRLAFELLRRAESERLEAARREADAQFAWEPGI